jgi:hypothetical protein
MAVVCIEGTSGREMLEITIRVPRSVGDASFDADLVPRGTVAGHDDDEARSRCRANG